MTTADASGTGGTGRPAPPRRGRRYVVARASDFAEGESRIFEINGRSIGVFRVDGAFHALLNRCPHAGGPLCAGYLIGTVEADRPGSYRFDAGRKLLTCPWHGWEYDLRTGQSYFDPSQVTAKPFPVQVEHGRDIAAAGGPIEQDDGSGLRKGPYVAEVFPISVEDDYVVVVLP